MVLYLISKLNLIYNLADQAYVLKSFVYTYVVVIEHKVEYTKIIKTTIGLIIIDSYCLTI